MNEYETAISDAHIAMLRSRIDRLAAENADLKRELRIGLKALHTAARGDEHGEWITVRNWLDKRGVYNGDLSASRLAEIVTKELLSILNAPSAARSADEQTG